MNKHTPGPWTLETVRTQSGICHKIGPFPPKTHHVHSLPRHACLYADYPSSSDPADQELEANARLIAAAPDMLEALDNIGGLSRALRVSGPDPMDLQGLSDALEEAVNMAHAAIAKARGES